MLWSEKLNWEVFYFVGILCVCSLITNVSGSIHEYKNEAFYPKSNAFFFHGGSEGLYASKLLHSPDASSPDKPLKGKSFIRYLFYFILFFQKFRI